MAVIMASLTILATLQSFASGCHFTKIKYENGTWCCDEDYQGDVVNTVSLPPEPTTPVDSTPPIIPVGDCVCGRGVEMSPGQLNRVSNTDDDRARQLVRPWMAHIYVKTDSLEHQECSGSLLNKRWFISAAHCYCGTVRPCPVQEQGFDKEWPPGDSDPVEKKRYAGMIERKISVQFGTEATDPEFRKFYKIEKIVIHPDYWQGPNEVAQPHDVALLMVVGEVKLQEEFTLGEPVRGIVPICLPPFMPVIPSDIGYGTKPEPSGLVGPFVGARDRVLNATAQIPFEDMDCFMQSHKTMQVPFPYRQVPDVSQGFLSCHPGGLTDPRFLHISGRSSYITAFGSTSREAGVGGDASLRYLCRTNAYGPTDSIFHDCHGKCHGNVTSSYQLGYSSNNSSQQRTSREPNPSLADPDCKRFWKDVAQTGRMEEDFRRDPRVANLKDVKPSKVILKKGGGQDVTCYPFSSTEAAQIENGYDFPYKHGWCRVCERKGVRGSQECDQDPAATLKPGSNWGWCQPECGEDWLQPDWHDFAHETMVDAYVYENCSHGIDTFSEFCTGSKMTTTYTMHYQANKGTTFQYIKGDLRTYHPHGYNNDESPWEEMPKNTLGQADENLQTQIRPGSKYQHLQHTQAEGDVCYGDAGGSVWKLWSFRDLWNGDKNDPEVRRPEHGRLAVLTGVISRFQHHCGFFRPDRQAHWSRPVQHSIHARVTTYLTWIMDTIKGTGVCGKLPVQGEKPASTEEPASTEGQ